ncbi:YTH domain-containing protein 2, partial [Perkinsus olseni]
MQPASEKERLREGLRVRNEGSTPMRVSRVGFRYFRLKRLRESLLPPSASSAGEKSLERCGVSLVLPTCVAEQYPHVNPHLFDANPKAAKFFVCKSNCEENVYMALRFGLWSPSSQDFLGKLRDTLRGYPSPANSSETSPHYPPVYLFFSVSGSGMFLGMCQAIGIDDTASLRWPDGVVRRGVIFLRWIFVRDVSNDCLQHLLVPMAHCPSTREPMPLPQCREGQEVPLQKGKEIMKIFRHAVRQDGVSLLDDVAYYDKKFNKAGLRFDGELGVVVFSRLR